MKLRVKSNPATFFKSRPLDSKCIPKEPGEIQVVRCMEEFEISSFRLDRNNHYRIELVKPIAGYSSWFVYIPHVDIIRDPSELPDSADLGGMKYKSQLDNRYNPTGSCNVTSVAMCLDYFGIKGNGNGQLEDQLYQYMLNNGLSRHSPADLAKVVADYGLKDKFKVYATIEECKSWLAAGNPCIVHGYFTAFGHIIVLRGYTPDGFLVNDPYGEWFFNGYRTDLSGERLLYSYDLIKDTCIGEDRSFWVHFISRKA